LFIFDDFESCSNFCNVFEVWRTTAGGKANTGKWFPAVAEDIAVWPAAKEDLKKFKFGVREVTIEEGNKVYLKQDVVDGINVWKTYQLISFSEVTNLLCKVEGL
jgi:hypothetical protein